MLNLERKYLSVADVEVDLEKRLIQGYFSKFTPDSIGDLTKKGTFTKTITERGPRPTPKGIRSKIKLGFNHGPVIGIPVVLHEDNTGAFYEGKIDPTPLGDDVLTRIDSGSLDTSSFEFRTIKASYPKNDSKVVRLLDEVKLHELGPVDYPIHEDTTTGRKSQECISSISDRLLHLLHKKSDDLSDIKELRALYDELTERLTVAVEETLPEVKSQPNGSAILKALQELNQKWSK